MKQKGRFNSVNLPFQYWRSFTDSLSGLLSLLSSCYLLIIADYSSDNATCGNWFACANIADEACDRICCLLSVALSAAKSTS